MTALLCPLLLAATAPLPLEDARTYPVAPIAPGQSVDLPLPPLPAKPGKVLVLRFRAVSETPTEGGCNYNLTLRLNGTPVGRYTAGGDERLIGRQPLFELSGGNYHGQLFPVFNGPQIMLIYAPTWDRGDKATADGLGATFALRLDDLARGVDNNTLTLRNNINFQVPNGTGRLLFENLQLGWVAADHLPRPPSRVPQRGPMADAVSAGGLTLRAGRNGGFSLRAGDGPELVVETGLGMNPDAPATIPAEDGAPPAGLQVAVEPFGAAGRRLTATWPDLRLERDLELRDGGLQWRETWINTGTAIRGVPFAHHLFLRDTRTRFLLSGSPDDAALIAVACNPTLFLEDADHPGRGVGVTAESDWLRLLMSLRAHGGMAELNSTCLALAPGSRIEFRLTLSPVAEGGYWRFLNDLRRRWGVNGLTMERAMYFGVARPTGQDPAAAWREAVGHLGPATIVLSPWQRLEPDARVVAAGLYPKLPAGAPPTPGKCPDLDVDAFLTYAHRAPYLRGFAETVALLHRELPQVKVIGMMHPAMEAVYKPLAERWPIADEAIRTPDGKPFEDAGYSRAWVGDMTAKDWGVLYYVPRPGSVYLEQLLAGMRWAMDEAGADGMYCDEFSWAWRTRAYSRYDYGRWDGYSADLDAEGKVVRLKADNAKVTEASQLRIAGEAVRRGKFFLGNAGNPLRALNATPIQRFAEGGNGHWTMTEAHLSPVPLVLGNFGDETTRPGIFAAVRTCLGVGCLYSPMPVNRLITGPDDFIPKLYPMTVRELGPGWVMGDERVATTVSRTFAWPVKGKVRVLRWGADAAPLPPVEPPAGETLAVEVPAGGLAIAERVN